MTNWELYVRLLTEMHHVHARRSTDSTRLRLQDVLIELRSRAAIELDRGWQITQDTAEAEAHNRIVIREQHAQDAAEIEAACRNSQHRLTYEVEAHAVVYRLDGVLVERLPHAFAVPSEVMHFSHALAAIHSIPVLKAIRRYLSMAEFGDGGLAVARKLYDGRVEARPDDL